MDNNTQDNSTQDNKETLDDINNDQQLQEFNFVDPMTHKSVTLPKMVGETDVQKLLENVIAKSNQNIRNKTKNEISTLQNQLNDFDSLKEQLEVLESKNMTDQELLQRNQTRQKAEYEKIVQESKNNLSALENEKLNNAIYSTASKRTDIYDIEQAKDLFNARCKPSIEKIDGEYKVLATIEGQLLDVDEAFSKWLDMPNNKNLLKNSLISGGGSNNVNTPNGNKTMNRENFDALPNGQKAELLRGGLVLTA